MERRILVNQNSFVSALFSKFTFLVSLFSVIAFALNAQSLLISRSVSNTDHCNNSQHYGAYLNFDGLDNYYELSNGEFQELSNNTATFTGTITNNTDTNIIFHIYATFSDRTFSTPLESPKANNCGNNDYSDWYYYTTTSGTLVGDGLASGANISFDRKGPSFQIGTGANQTEGANTFNASGWLNLYINSQPDNNSLHLDGISGDFNINLSGNALQSCSTNLTYGGSIAGYEVEGGSYTGSTITSAADPSGANGTIQYQWLKSTDPTLPWEQWTMIENSDSPTYEPGLITETTYFLRCARILGCLYYTGESNIIAKIINGDAVECNTGAQVNTIAGNAIETSNNNGVVDAHNITGTNDEHFAQFWDNDDNIIIELDDELQAGDQLTISWKERNYSSSYSGQAQLMVEESLDGTNFSNNTVLSTSIEYYFVHHTITLGAAAKYLRLKKVANTPDLDVDAISYSLKTCIENGSIGNFVWEDLNGNGIQENGEPGVQGVFIFLEDTDQNPIPGYDFVLSDENGFYSFDNLPFGDYVVRFATPSGFLPTKSNNTSDESDSDASFLDGRSGTITISADNLDDNTIDAGYTRQVKLTGRVWFDDNDENGIQEANVQGVENIEVDLFNAGADEIAGTEDDVKFGSITTDELGFYTFDNIAPGKYYTAFNTNSLPVGYTFTQQNQGNNDFTDSDANLNTGFSDVFDLTSNLDQSGVDAGLVLSCGFIPEVITDDENCQNFPVYFEALPNTNGYTYEWTFLDDVTNPVVIGQSTDGVTDFAWNTPGQKIYKLTVTDASGCSVALEGKLTVLSEDEASCQENLPVELTSFNGQLINKDQVKLDWTTAWEKDNNFFEVERSTDGVRFTTIGLVEGQGTTETVNDYQFLDETPAYGRNYYRLKQIDFDGTTDYSGIVIVTLDGDELPDVMTYPNPTKGLTTLRVVEPFETTATVEIVNSTGKILNVISIEAGTNNVMIDLSDYPTGLYYLNIRYNDFKKIVKRVSKIRD